MVSKVPNENIKKLKELSDKLCDFSNSSNENSSINIISEIKNIVEIENKNISSNNNKDEKIICYENMCSKIKIILNRFKIV
jgi:hypothetical protein